jgi:hypothetical protein
MEDTKDDQQPETRGSLGGMSKSEVAKLESLWASLIMMNHRPESRILWLDIDSYMLLKRAGRLRICNQQIRSQEYDAQIIDKMEEFFSRTSEGH